MDHPKRTYSHHHPNGLQPLGRSGDVRRPLYGHSTSSAPGVRGLSIPFFLVLSLGPDKSAAESGRGSREPLAAEIVVQRRGRVADERAVRGDPPQARVVARAGQHKVEAPLANVGLQLRQRR
jgi:hypothetical protein